MCDIKVLAFGASLLVILGLDDCSDKIESLCRRLETGKALRLSNLFDSSDVVELIGSRTGFDVDADDPKFMFLEASVDTDIKMVDNSNVAPEANNVGGLGD